MVIFRVDLGKDGKLTWETESEDLEGIFVEPEIRAYVENELQRMIRILLGSMRSPDTAQAMKELSRFITDFAQTRLARVRQLSQN